MPEAIPTCRIHEIIGKFDISYVRECSREAWDQDPEGLCLLHSRQAVKDKDGAFTDAVRAKLELEDYDFRGVFFPGPFDLVELTGQLHYIFTKDAEFHRAIFQGKADFFGAAFQWANFFGATFQELGRFQEVTFKERARFTFATFQKAYFADATFQEVADFDFATFHDSALFRDVTFHDLALFLEATFKGEAGFYRINPQGSVFSGVFRDVTLDKEASLVFKDANLSRVQFIGTDLRRTEFHNVIWARRHGRNVVYDEEYVQQFSVAEKYARLEELYRQLKLNYEQEGNLKKSGDFHYGEMEMHRRANPGQLWYQFYWALSGYGERPLRSLLVLWGFFLVFAGLFFWQEPSLPGGHTWGGLGNAILYVFQKGTLQRPDPNWLDNASSLSKLLAAIIPVLIPGQVTLFFLALRNRLGRRR
jgi:uncharacterized protein YjbI with pentapeptide repeats